jgi:hypothetical protein
MNSSKQLTARSQARQSNLHFWPSQHSGCDDRLPKEQAETRNHNNPKDKAPCVATEGLVVAGDQLVGIAHANSSIAPQQANFTRN